MSFFANRLSRQPISSSSSCGMSFQSSLRKYEPSSKVFSSKSISNIESLQAPSQTGSTSENNSRHSHMLINLNKKIKIARKSIENEENHLDEGEKENVQLNGNLSIFRGDSFKLEKGSQLENPLKQKLENCLNIEQLLFTSPTLNIQETIQSRNIFGLQEPLQAQQDIKEAEFEDDCESELEFIEPIKQLSKTDSCGLVLKPYASFSEPQIQCEPKYEEILAPVPEICQMELEKEDENKNMEEQEEEIHIKTKLSLRLLKRKLENKSLEQVAKEMARSRKIEFEGKVGENEKTAVYEALISFLKHQLHDC